MFNQKEYNRKYYTKNAIKINKRQKKYYDKNAVKISKYQKKYRSKNAVKISKYQKKYRSKNAVKIREQRKKYYAKNAVKINKRHKKYYAKNAVKINEQKKKYNAKNAVKISKRMKKYRAKNAVKINEHLRKRLKTDKLYKATCTLRSRMRKAFKAKGFIKNKKTLEILGCTGEKFKKHIESQFKRGMSWKNHGFGSNKWNYDHIIPLATAKTVEDLYRLNHYTNLQPLWHTDNLKKGAKILNSD